MESNGDFLAFCYASTEIHASATSLKWPLNLPPASLLKEFLNSPNQSLKMLFAFFSCKITDLINGAINHLRPKAECGTLYNNPSFKL